MSPEPSLKYVVVENAGYQGEQDVFSHPDFRVAEKWLKDRYTDFEVRTCTSTSPVICQMAIVPMKSSPTPEMVRYSLAWRNPHTQPPGPRVLHAVLVTRGEKCPQEILDLWSPGCGYAVTWELVTQRPIRRWRKEARARVRRKTLERRMTAKFPLFAVEFIAQELEKRPQYYDSDY